MVSSGLIVDKEELLKKRVKTDFAGLEDSTILLMANVNSSALGGKKQKKKKTAKKEFRNGVKKPKISKQFFKMKLVAVITRNK